jgi:hypothetical protein
MMVLVALAVTCLAKAKSSDTIVTFLSLRRLQHTYLFSLHITSSKRNQTISYLHLLLYHTPFHSSILLKSYTMLLEHFLYRTQMWLFDMAVDLGTGRFPSRIHIDSCCEADIKPALKAEAVTGLPSHRISIHRAGVAWYRGSTDRQK